MDKAKYKYVHEVGTLHRKMISIALSCHFPKFPRTFVTGSTRKVGADTMAIQIKKTNLSLFFEMNLNIFSNIQTYNTLSFARKIIF